MASFVAHSTQDMLAVCTYILPDSVVLFAPKNQRRNKLAPMRRRILVLGDFSLCEKVVHVF